MSKSLEEQVRDLHAVLEVVNSISTHLDLDSLLHSLIQETTRVMDADRSSLFVYDSATHELWIKIAEGIGEKEIRLPVNRKSIAGTVAETKELLNITDAYSSELFNPDVDRKTGYRTRTILTCPMLNYRDEIVGVIQVLNKKNGESFSEYDEKLLGTLSSSAALAIERTMLIDKQLENEKLKQQMEIASAIQESLFPQEIPLHPAIEIHGYSDACDETGGDYYDVFDLGEGRLGFVVGDISGHGIGAALLMTTARAFLKALLKNDEDYMRVFFNLNNMLEEDMDDARFMTMFFGVIDQERKFSYISAGHEPPLLYRASTGEFSELESTGTVLGMMDEMDFELEGPIDLESGDVLVLFTDGVFEAMNEKNEEFGRKRTQEAIECSRSETPERISELLISQVLSFCGNAPRRDDITLIVGKVK